MAARPAAQQAGVEHFCQWELLPDLLHCFGTTELTTTKKKTPRTNWFLKDCLYTTASVHKKMKWQHLG